MPKILVAGATGAVGSRVVRLLGDHQRRTLSRRPMPGDHCAADACDPAAIRGVCGGIETVVSCLGSSVAFGARESRSYHGVDTVANCNLINEAKRSGVRRFVYVAAHIEDGYARTAYIRAHEVVVAALSASGLAYSVIRPTGIFTALDDLVTMAKWGIGVVAGSGNARTNPVHPDDVAEVCFASIAAAPVEISVGGPEIMTRRQIAETAFEAVGKQPRIVSIPAGVFRFGARIAGLTNRRRGELLEFAGSVSVSDGVAPAIGRLRLIDYFREVARSH